MMLYRLPSYAVGMVTTESFKKFKIGWGSYIYGKRILQQFSYSLDVDGF